jgi:hypothetical protein
VVADPRLQCGPNQQARGSGGLTSIIDGVGGPVTSTNPGLVEPVDLVSFP